MKTNDEIVDVNFESFLTTDARYAQAGCEFICISCNTEISYSAIATGTEKIECDTCQRVYFVESIVENETYDEEFDKKNQCERVLTLAVYTKISNSRRFISDK